MEPTVNEFSEEYPELYRFWSENFQSYLKKSKKKLKKKNFRRNFQGRVVNSILIKEQPNLILNLFTGYLGNFHAIFDSNFFQSDFNQETKNEKFYLWINIDLLPEGIEANCKYLYDFWGFKSTKVVQTKYAMLTNLNNGFMYHLIGDLTVIGKLIGSWEELCYQYSNSIVLGIEGIMNLPLLTRNDLFLWWNQFKRLIKNTNLFFGSWMVAGKNWEGLLTKIIFYQDVVKLKHNQPFKYGKLERIRINQDENKLRLLYENELPWDIELVNKNIVPKIDSDNDCILISFYSDKINQKSSLRFISSYIVESTLKKLLGEELRDTHQSLFGYKIWEEYFGLQEENKEKLESGFVKVLPFGFKRIKV